MLDNKRNLQYFEAPSMRELFDAMQAWQAENKQRFLSLNVEREENSVCCIALTNPSEVIIVDGSEMQGVEVFNRKLLIRPLDVEIFMRLFHNRAWNRPTGRGFRPRYSTSAVGRR